MRGRMAMRGGSMVADCLEGMMPPGFEVCRSNEPTKAKRKIDELAIPPFSGS